MTASFTPSNISAVTARITTALRNVRQAMTSAGYATSQYAVLVQTYPSPISRGSAFRYQQSRYDRQSIGAAASGTPTPTGRTTSWCPRSTSQSGTR